MGSVTPLPYWQVNVPESQREATCPPFLLNLNPKDHGIISTPDSAYLILSFPEIQAFIAQNRLDIFQRVPSELRRYFEYNYGLKQRYGSVMQFVLSQRLHWTLPVIPHGAPFENEADIKILHNDWPYGIDPRIVHLVVWTKFDLEDDPATDDLTPRARRQIDEYVDRVFAAEVGRDNVIWFKNWKSLKSVHSVEHFHVMIFDPAEDFVDRITGKDVPLSKKVARGEAGDV